MKAFESEENIRSDYTTSGQRLLGGNNDYTSSDASCEERYFITPEKNFKKMSEESGQTYYRRKEMKG